METVTIKMEDSLAKTLEKKMKVHHYTTKTEFIREAIRDKITDLDKKEAHSWLKSIYGASKRKTTDADLKRAREEAFEELEREIQ